MHYSNTKFSVPYSHVGPNLSWVGKFSSFNLQFSSGDFVFLGAGLIWKAAGQKNHEELQLSFYEMAFVFHE